MKSYKYSSEDGIQKLNGILYYYKNNVLHRDDGPAIIAVGGATHWYKNGTRHRDDEPAIEHGGYKVWIVNGKKHREDGPAILDENRNNKSYYYYDIFVKVDNDIEFAAWKKFKAFL